MWHNCAVSSAWYGTIGKWKVAAGGRRGCRDKDRKVGACIGWSGGGSSLALLAGEKCKLDRVPKDQQCTYCGSNSHRRDHLVERGHREVDVEAPNGILK